MDRSNDGKLSGRGVAVGTFITEAPLVATVRIAAAAGADFVIFDCEHGCIELRDLRAAIALCRSQGLQALVRIPEIETHWIAKALDSGAHGIVAPNVETVAEAKRLVDQASFPPAGRRGASFGSAQDDYSGGDIAGKVERAGRELIVLCMVESPVGLDNVEAIVALPGISGCWFGYIDFSIASGLPGEINHPDVLAAAQRVADACAAQCKIAGVMTTSLDHLEQYLSRRYNVAAWASDAFVLKSGFATGFLGCRDALKRHSSNQEKDDVHAK
jgi:2-keto-3-deoxy-L-rhamnonate aldolase RhmA